MAGYLGKISAVVSANTADFDSKLSASAREVSVFARAVQSNLTAASRDAARALDSIYTPIQRFERSLQAAASMKLSFAGFAGAIKDVDVLRQRLMTMKDTQIALVVKTSGMKSITDFRAALSGIQAKDLAVIVKVGGLEKVRELRAMTADKRVDFALNLIDAGLGKQLNAAKTRVSELKTEISAMKAAGGAAGDGGAATIAVAYRAATAEHQRLRAEARESIRVNFGINVEKDALVDRILGSGTTAAGINLQAVIDVIGGEDLKDVVTKSQQLMAAAQGLNKPFAAAKDQIVGMSMEIQRGFHGALVRSQSQLQTMNREIEAGKRPAAEMEAMFAGVDRRVRSAVVSVQQLAEASQKIGNMKSGQELGFARPQLAAALDRGVEAGTQAASLPAATIQANPRIAGMLADIARLSNEAAAAYARLQTKAANGLSTGAAEKSLTDLEAKLAAVLKEFSGTYQVHLDTAKAKKDLDDLVAKTTQMRESAAFTVTGRPQNLDQADARHSRLEGKISGLDRSQRQNFQPLLDEAVVARNTGSLEHFSDVHDRIEFALSRTLRLKVTTDEATKHLAEFRSLADSLGPAGGMDALRKSAQSADSAVNKLTDSVEKTMHAAHMVTIQTDIRAIGHMPVGPRRDAEIDRVAASAEGLAGRAGATGTRDAADAATVAATRERIAGLNAAWAQSIRGLPQTQAQISSFFTGILADIGKLDAVDRMNLDPMIASIMGLVRSGAGIAVLTQRLLELETVTKEVTALGAVGIKVGSLSPGAVRDDLQARVEAAKTTRPGGESAESLGRETDARASLGKSLTDPARQMTVLEGSITSLKGQLDTLPESVRSRFIPALAAAETEFTQLGLSAHRLPGVIELAQQRLRALAADATRASAAMNFRGGFGGEGAEGLNLGLDQRALAGHTAQLQILQGALGRASAEARGPGVEAFERLRLATATAFDEGRIDAVGTRAELARLRQEAVAAVAAVSGVRSGALGRDVARAGDVGRGGMDRLSMGLNQALYGIDDLMSSTGGLEQKLRAVSNNVTQMGFVIGGTAGLFFALGAVMAGQAAVALVKWYTGGKTAEDQTKALNDALARQKSLVEELVQAYKSLGDSLARGTFSSGAEGSRGFTKQLDDVKDKQNAVRRERRAGGDLGVQERRSEQVMLQKKLDSSSNPGERVGLNARLQWSKDWERDQIARVNNEGRLPFPVSDVQKSLRGFSKGQFAAGPLNKDGSTNLSPVEKTVEAVADRFKGGNSVADLNRQLADLKDARSALAKPASSDWTTGSSRTITEIDGFIRRIEASLEYAVAAAANNIIESSRRPALQIAQSQEQVADAIRRGVPGASLFQNELDGLARRLADAQQKIEGIANFDELKPEQKVRLFGKETMSPEERTASLKRSEDQVLAVKGMTATIDKSSRDMRLSRSFGGERATSAKSSLGTGDRFQNERAFLTAAIDKEVDARNRLDLATQGGVQAEMQLARGAVEVAQKEAEAAAGMAEATIALEAATARIRKIGESAIQKSEQGDAAAQKHAEDNPFRGGVGMRKRLAEHDLMVDRERVGKADNALTRATAAAGADPRIVKLDAEMEAIKQQRQVQEADSARLGKPADQKALEELSNKELEINHDRERILNELTRTEKDQLAAINNGIAARERENEKSRKRENENPNRVFGQAGQVMQDSQRFADEAQQRYINNPTPQNYKERNEADDQATQDRRRMRPLEDNLEAKKAEIESGGKMTGLRENVAEIDIKLAGLAEKEAEVGKLGEADSERRKSLHKSRADLQSAIENDIAMGTSGERDALDKAQTEQSDRFRARRGRDLGMTETERFKRDAADGPVGDLTAEAKRMQREDEKNKQRQDADKAGLFRNPFLVDDQSNNKAAQKKFLKQGIQNQMEQVAPMLKEFEDERQTAIKGGPSRAALNVSDASTTQGSSELNRLLRGDDSAKNVNLAELQKQNEKLQVIIDQLKEKNPEVLV